MKCESCRKDDAELTTRWERVRNWLFLRLNHTLFPTDFMDFRSERYTKGYSDGYVAGTEAEHRHQEKQYKLYG